MGGHNKVKMGVKFLKNCNLTPLPWLSAKEYDPPFNDVFLKRYNTFNFIGKITKITPFSLYYDPLPFQEFCSWVPIPCLFQPLPTMKHTRVLRLIVNTVIATLHCMCLRTDVQGQQNRGEGRGGRCAPLFLLAGFFFEHTVFLRNFMFFPQDIIKLELFSANLRPNFAKFTPAMGYDINYELALT